MAYHAVCCSDSNTCFPRCPQFNEVVTCKHIVQEPSKDFECNIYPNGDACCLVHNIQQHFPIVDSSNSPADVSRVSFCLLFSFFQFTSSRIQLFFSFIVLLYSCLVSSTSLLDPCLLQFMFTVSFSLLTVWLNCTSLHQEVL